MTNEDDAVSLPALRMQVSILQRDFYKHSESVNQNLKRIFDFISEEIGARRERENNLTMVNQKSELTWTKMMAIAGIIGAFQCAPSIFHAFFH